MKNTKKSQTPKFAVGSIIKHPKRGIGIIKQIDDRMYPVYEFFYYVSFCGRGGDGSKVWLPKFKTEKTCEVVGMAT